MSRHIRVTTKPHDPVVTNQLVRLLVAQATLETMKQQAAAEVEAAKGTPRPQEQAS